WGLGLPAPLLMACLAWAAEYLGAICLAVGFAVRWVCIPLMFTMIVAATTVHWANGWQAVHDLKSPYASLNAETAIERLSRAKSILKEHGNYDWLSEHGSFVVSNNGIEWAATYFVLLAALLFIGGGRYFSVDYWIRRKYTPHDR
ncbi:MAG: DoxX family protein, partial [Gammaproteobacteria bacterium]|nr:DoxX family protein [Gammaproteobacteria bacterium]